MLDTLCPPVHVELIAYVFSLWFFLYCDLILNYILDSALAETVKDMPAL